MQEHTFEHLLLQGFVQLEITVFVVSRDRVAAGRHMYTDLVRAARLNGYLQQRQLGQPQSGLRGQTLAQLAIAWVLRHPQMTSALVGASKVSQVEDNIAALNNLHFSADELAAIEAILRDDAGEPIW